MIQLDQDIIKTNILSKFEKDWIKTVVARGLTRYFYDLTYLPIFSFYPTHVQTLPSYHQDTYSEQVCGRLDKKCGHKSANTILQRFDLVTYILTKILSRQMF